MIIRLAEAQVIPGRIEEFLEQLRGLVADFPTLYDGLLSHEVLIETTDPDR